MFVNPTANEREIFRRAGLRSRRLETAVLPVEILFEYRRILTACDRGHAGNFRDFLLAAM
ncbi:MAG: hypothetical protein EBY29_15725 [Planctomycetes bacterium]|nr:hypothetical protein [Planctomycetota bacterium]